MGMPNKIGDADVVKVSEITLENLMEAKKRTVIVETERDRLFEVNSDQNARIVELMEEAVEKDLEITELQSRLYSSKQETANSLSLLRDYHVAYNALHRDPSSVNKKQIESVDAKVLTLLVNIVTQGGRIKFADESQGTANDNDVATTS